MTKREPFAQFEDYHEGYELPGMLLGGVCFIELPMGAPGDMEIVDKTNAAHEARVKEAVEKAVAVAQYECGCAKCVNPPEGK